MKKYFIATIVALSLATAGTLRAEEGGDLVDLVNTPEVFGQIKGAYEYDGTHNFTTRGGTYAGVQLEQDVWEVPVFGTLSAEIDEDLEVTARDAFVGARFGPVEISVGRMPSIERGVADSTVNIFEGANFEGDGSSGRNGNQFKTKLNMYGVGLVSTFKSNSGFDNLDNWGLGASYKFKGVGLVGAYAQDDVTGVNTFLGGSTYTISGVTIGGTFARDENRAGATTNTLSYVAAYTLGQNVFRGGYQNIQDDTNKYILEVAHNLDDSAAVYVNGVHDEDNVLTVGVRFSF